MVNSENQITQQLAFNPVDYYFEWTDNWYKWDYAAAHTLAKRARDDKWRELKKHNISARRFVVKNQIMRRGGIGTDYPDIELLANVYMIEVIG